jgi:hypothetical protein
MKKYAMGFLMFGASTGLVHGQSSGNSTEEMLDAKRVTDFIVIKIDPESKVVEYQLDDDSKSRKFKQYLGKLCLGVVEAGETKQLRVEMAFLNPFKYRVTLTDTLLRDPSYESPGKLLALVDGIAGQLGPTGNSPGATTLINQKKVSVVNESVSINTQALQTVDSDLKANSEKLQNLNAKNQSNSSDKKKNLQELSMLKKTIDSEKKESAALTQELAALNLIDSIQVPTLNSWLYLIQADSARRFWLSGFPKKSDGDSLRSAIVIKALRAYTGHYYQNGLKLDSTFLGKVGAALNRVGQATSYDELQKAQVRFYTDIVKLKSFNEKGKALANAFQLELGSPLPGERRKNPAGRRFALYSRDVFSELVDQAKQIQQLRDTMVTVLHALSAELKEVRKSTDNTRSSSLLARMLVSDDQMRDFTIKVQPRTIQTTNGGITVEAGKPIVSSKIRVRASKRVIPEFATGVFYTNLRYPRYGTKVINGESFVALADPTRYEGVVAAHLNLVLNAWEGFIHPLAQVGIGTAKDTPSLLAGGGLRFTGSARLALTGGVLWTWRRELDKLSVGDKIDGTAQLESDLKLALRSTPSFYIGLQREF